MSQGPLIFFFKLDTHTHIDLSLALFLDIYLGFSPCKSQKPTPYIQDSCWPYTGIAMECAFPPISYACLNLRSAVLNVKENMSQGFLKNSALGWFMCLLGG